MDSLCPKCSRSDCTTSNGRDRQGDRALFRCRHCGYQWREGTVPRFKISEREQAIWDCWQRHGQKIRPASRELRDPATQPYYPAATPEYVRRVVARIKSKLKPEGDDEPT